MASIARSLRPCASRLIVRPSQPYRALPFAARAFSASRAAQVKRYSKDHEWVEMSADNKTAMIGISEYAASALGDVVYVELPTVPMEVAAGDSIGAVESVKSASDIISPITCKVTAVNSLLEEKPGSINQGPEDDSAAGGWVAKVVVPEAGVKDFEELMDAEKYKEFTEE
ncbi:Glycine cleavage system H protein, mitochondrial [Lachnellula hyalina]|uniref:Glycine cleavage system H protein n=1 Tax=Lachnellula hyalina TaxID=1316788 RepID=A0A8H8R3Z9_9HELO|nr:Glycine cleavage system H protein, mitochondrial [Lachnellula hyalina]TVY27631.1 Glycine cleavage system H protein, mitochondrial [Lachnellula hyalina]